MSNKGKAGSLIDFRIAVENKALDSAILSLNSEWSNSSIDWKSPISRSGYKEFVDDSFWNGKLTPNETSFWEGIEKPERFWPQGGPNWDGLATISHGGKKDLLLFEAKAHKGELISSCGAKEPSRTIIRNHIEEAKRLLKFDSSSDWLGKYYQFANRFAYVNMLRARGVSAYCVYVYFANDPYWNLSDKTTVTDFENAISEEYQYLGIKDAKLENCYIYKLMVDLNNPKYLPLRSEIIKKLNGNMIAL